MKVITDQKDNCGRCPIIFKNCKNIDLVHEYLFRNYNGYHFTIMLNEMSDEFVPLGKDLYVYFSDEALEEIKAYAE